MDDEPRAATVSDDAEADAAASDPYARPRQTFPHLPETLAARVEAYGTPEPLAAGTYLYREGDRSVDFFLVLEGAIEVLDRDPHGAEQIFTTHGPRQFTGELDLFNDREVLVSARAAKDSTVLRVRRADFRKMVSAEPDIGEIVLRAFILRRVGLIQHAQGGAVLIGSGHAGDTIRLQRFMTRNAYPHRMLDVDSDPDARGALDCFGIGEHELPVVVTHGDHVLRNPSNAELADVMGITESFDPDRTYDVAVVGAGPAGLAAAVYAASEGLDTIVIEALAPGGQAGTSSRIENYLGFPTGISGQALAGRAQVQAQKFGARLAISRAVATLECHETPYRLVLADGVRVAARAVVVATGARYRKLDVPDYERFEGQGIYYAASAIEARLCAGEEVIVVGGGNSAGQAAMFLSTAARHVHILVRGAGLAATMSDYLVQRIQNSPKITVHAHTEISGLEGDALLRTVRWKDRRSGAEESHAIGTVFAMIGAQPNTAWLGDCVKMDKAGFVETGTDEDGTPLASPYATSRAGVYAVGDVRAGSVKRVASGVGEGSVVVQAIHAWLAEPGA